ncbi:uncharacterized protein UBRO_20409 [Ustilago bromivora]|uniref:HTH CENPB-type domain-containing protein n=1 Tax=Ustilago bromivora TaxID=307758 RepID=A0A1K0FV93_9BASI|nr:uncharacterized protein UBRO_20409 [Ustilago bromivora]
MANISPRKRIAKAQLQTDRDQKEHEIQEALSAFQKGQFKDLKATTEHHNVPYNTLWDCSKGHKSRTAAFQHLQAIPPEAEELLVQHIQKQAHYGFLVTPQNLRQLAEQLLRQRTDNNDATLGPNWVSAFKQQHPELRSYYSHKMDAARVQATSDPSVIEVYFDVLEKTIAKYRILPKNIFNMDETGFLIGQRRMGRISASGHSQAIGRLSQWLSALGKNHMQGWYHNHTAAKGWVFATSQNGWTDNELALHWLKDCFDKHTKQRAQGKYRLLILDVHGSHITAEFIQQAWDSHIVCLCLPPHATHLLQPLDVLIFGPLQQAFTKEVDKFAGVNISISKKDFNSKLHLEKVLWHMPSYHRESTPPSSAPAVEETPTTPSTPEEAKKLLAQMYAIVDQDQEEQQALLASNH